MPPLILARLSNAMPLGPWTAVLEIVAADFPCALAKASAMDWVSAGTGVRPLSSTSGTKRTFWRPVAADDAIRVYLWLGISDPNTPGLRDLLTAISRYGCLYEKPYATAPEVVDAGGRVLGLKSRATWTLCGDGALS